MIKSTQAIKLLTAVTAVSALSMPILGLADNGRKLDIQIGSDTNASDNPFVQPQDPALSGGGRDQTLQFGDVLTGTRKDDLLIGGLGTDVLMGNRRNDVIIGGIEHFNPLNRDRAFGGRGNDIFIWKPGDGSDFWDGGPGRSDVIIFGITGELVDGEVQFAVSNDQQSGEVAIDPQTHLPSVDVSGSPGFCEVIDSSADPEAEQELAALDLDHLVRFSIRGVADAFKRGEQSDDNGLRVTLHLKDVEILVCTNRDGGIIEVVDLTETPPQTMSLDDVRPKSLRERLESIIF